MVVAIIIAILVIVFLMLSLRSNNDARPRIEQESNQGFKERMLKNGETIAFDTRKRRPQIVPFPRAIDVSQIPKNQIGSLVHSASLEHGRDPEGDTYLVADSRAAAEEHAKRLFEHSPNTKSVVFTVA